MGSGKFNVFSGWNAPKIGDEIVLWPRRVAEQRGAKQSAVGFFNRDAQGSRLAS
jgi:hypothetical protein